MHRNESVYDNFKMIIFVISCYRLGCLILQSAAFPEIFRRRTYIVSFDAGMRYLFDYRAEYSSNISCVYNCSSELDVLGVLEPFKLNEANNSVKKRWGEGGGEDREMIEICCVRDNSNNPTTSQSRLNLFEI